MNLLTDTVELIQAFSKGLTLRHVAAFLFDAIPYFIQFVQLFFYTVIYTLLHTGPLGAMTTADQEYPENAHGKGGLSYANGKPMACPYANRAERFPYIAPKHGDDRSPCPALNTLANHGFIPRNGRGLTAPILIKGLREGYNISIPLAAALAYGGVLLLGQVVGFGKDPRRDGVGFSLRDLARHDRIEHDASITHANTAPGDEYAPSEQDPVLFDTFVRDARPTPGPLNEGELSYGPEDIARTRVRAEAVPGVRIDALHQELARGEVALVFGIFGFLPSGGNEGEDRRNLPDEVLGGPYRFPLSIVETWWKENRLPTPDWTPVRKTTLFGTFAQSARIRKEMEKLKAKGANKAYM